MGSAPPAGRPSTTTNRVPELRRARGWTQAELAARLAVSRQTVNAIERGRGEPTLALAFQVAAVFGQPIEAIFRPPAGRAG